MGSSVSPRQDGKGGVVGGGSGINCFLISCTNVVLCGVVMGGSGAIFFSSYARMLCYIRRICLAVNPALLVSVYLNTPVFESGCFIC